MNESSGDVCTQKHGSCIYDGGFYVNKGIVQVVVEASMRRSKVQRVATMKPGVVNERRSKASYTKNNRAGPESRALCGASRKVRYARQITK